MSKPHDPARALHLARRRLEKAAADVLRLSLEVAGAGSGTETRNLKPETFSDTKHGFLIEDLRRSGCASHVLKAYIVPVTELIGVPKNPKALFLKLCTDLAQYPETVLKIAADHTTSKRSMLSTPAQALEDVKTVLPKCPHFKITSTHPAWHAWRLHYEGQGKKQWASYCEGQGYFREISEYPPGHWGNNGAVQQNEKAA